MSIAQRFTIALSLLALGVAIASPAYAQTPAKDLTSEEQALCRSDAIRLCFFKISDASALRTCLRSNKSSLSVPCRKLIESRGG
jgi:hypothetical protein